VCQRGDANLTTRGPRPKVILTAVEGAILLARAQRTVAPLDDVEAELSFLLESRIHPPP
jgi:hypothetical protein